MLNNVVVALGSNLGDPAKNLDAAIGELNAILDGPSERSSYWLSAPQDMDASAGSFLNALIIGKTVLSAQDLLAQLHKIEAKLGRVRSQGKTVKQHESRTIDLDIITYGEAIICEENLVIPHPRAHQRLFVLMPLEELCPKFILPGQSLSLQALIDSAPKIEITRLARTLP